MIKLTIIATSCDPWLKKEYRYDTLEQLQSAVAILDDSHDVLRENKAVVIVDHGSNVSHILGRF